MRSGTKRSVLGKVILLAAMTLCGCATSERSAAIPTATIPTTTLQTVQGDYDQAELQAEATTKALIELSVSAPEDIPQAFETFSKSVDIMRAAGSRIIEHSDGMYYTGPAYFVEAAKTVTSCEYPRVSAGRNTHPAELGPYFDEMAEEGMELKRTYRAFEFDISQIRDSLAKNDNADPRGVEAMSLFFRKAQLDSAHLEAALERSLAIVERAKAAKAKAAKSPAPPTGS